MKQICIGPCKRKLAMTEENFYRNSNYKSGFATRCKQCVAKANAINFQKRQKVKKLKKEEEIYALCEEEPLTPFDKGCLHRRWNQSQQIPSSMDKEI